MLLSFYGDDFTGSTDVMESLAMNGVPTVLFTRIPSAQEQARFAGFEAVGIAGTSRSQTPDWMNEHLSRAFDWLKGLGARFCHYKVCSTFDSAPHVGNIGRAIEIGREVFGQGVTPLVVGAPQLKRYTAFGNLFAGYQGQTYRIDRHPVMSRHPVTPMDEADLRLHLARQTALPVDLVPANVVGNVAAVDEAVAAARGVLMFDVFDMATQMDVGRQLLRLSDQLGPFVAGSSGVSYALVKALGSAPASFPALPAVDQIIAVSGSCSPTTARQIRYALDHGFAGIHADPLMLAGTDGEAAVARIIAEANGHLGEGRSVLIYTALDPEMERGSGLDAMAGGRHRVGQALGRIARAAISAHGLTRAILAGGDTSSHALGELDVFALTTRLPLPATPGSPLCMAASADPALDGLEIAMKGGQVGADDYFVALRDGIAP
jgi:3-oxoisoapionate kinase